MNEGPYKATKLWNQVVRDFRAQMPRKRHRKHVRHFDDCFTATEAIDWLHCYMQNGSNFNPNVTREQTLQLLKKFIQNGLLEDIRGDKCIEPEEFKDNSELYRFNKKSPMKLTRTPKIGVLNENTLSKKENLKEDIKKLPNCQLITRQLSVINLENVWKTITLKKLQDKLELPNVEAIINTSNINAKFIIHNSTKVNKNGMVICIDKSDDLPSWILSAMKCLANWPNASGSASCLPNYPAFQSDVFTVVKDYFTNLQEPLLDYNTLINAFVRCEYLNSNVSNSSSLSCEQILDMKLPPTLCFETAFTSAEPITRIIPHQNMNIDSSSDCSHTPFYLHQPKDKSVNGYDNLAYLTPNSEDSSTVTSYYTVPTEVERKRYSHTSSSTSYHTPCCENEPIFERRSCSLPSKQRDVELWVKNSFWNGLVNNSCNHLAVDVFQLLCLFLPPNTRRKLHFLLKFMKAVGNNEHVTLTRKEVLDTFMHCIINSVNDYNQVVAIRAVNLLVDNYEIILVPPKDLIDQVGERLNYLSREKIEYSLGDATSVTYCQQVSKEQYEKQKENHSLNALRDLFDTIIQDERLSEKEKLKKLKKFKQAYPDIYKEKMVNEEILFGKKVKKFTLLQRVKSVRI